MKSLYYKLGRLIIKEHMKQYNITSLISISEVYTKNKRKIKIISKYINFFFEKILIIKFLHKKINILRIVTISLIIKI